MHFIEGKLGEERNAVPALLAMGHDIVAKRLDLGGRKAFVDRLDFLEADDVGLFFFEPTHQQFKPGLDAIDIPGGDAQGHGSLRL